MLIILFLYDDTLQSLGILHAILTFFVLQKQQNLGRRFGTGKMHLSSPVALAAAHSKGGGSVVVVDCCSHCGILYIVVICKKDGKIRKRYNQVSHLTQDTHAFLCALLYVHSSFVIISIGKRELVALLCLSSCCLMIAVWLFLTMTRVCLHFVIVVFPDHMHLLFLIINVQKYFLNSIADTQSLYKITMLAGKLF